VTEALDFGIPGLNLAPGDHICALYMGAAERDAILLPYLQAGLRSGDKCICVVDQEARVVRGRWDVTPAIHLHTEIHRVRPDARVVVHNHPYYVSLIAALGTLPELVHQTGSLFLDDMYLLEKYDGEIDAPWRAAELAQQIGSANLVILANHGVIATGRNMAEAVYRAVSIERVCHLAYDVMVTGRTPSKMNRGDMVGMQASLIERAADVYWAGAARMTIKADRSVLT